MRFTSWACAMLFGRTPTIVSQRTDCRSPCDVGQIAIRKYHDLGEGIDYDEAERMEKEVSEAMKIIFEKSASGHCARKTCSQRP
jgi:hypothetical protein